MAIKIAVHAGVVEAEEGNHALGWGQVPVTIVKLVNAECHRFIFKSHTGDELVVEFFRYPEDGPWQSAQAAVDESWDAARESASEAAGLHLCRHGKRLTEDCIHCFDIEEQAREDGFPVGTLRDGITTTGFNSPPE
jgi:hypothetical protein